jgi:hypothetical protein
MKSSIICYCRRKDNHKVFGYVIHGVFPDKDISTSSSKEELDSVKMIEGLFFGKCTWVEVNKNKSAPKVCLELQITHKPINNINDSFWDSFEKITAEEYATLCMINGK